MKNNILTVGLFLFMIGCLNINVLAAAETTSGTGPTAVDVAKARGGSAPDPRERKIPLSNATSAWGYYGVTPDRVTPIQPRTA